MFFRNIMMSMQDPYSSVWLKVLDLCTILLILIRMEARLRCDLY